VRGDIRGVAVPGSSPGSPHAVDRGDIATGGEADGEGELVPPPLSLTLQIPCFCRQPPPRSCLRQRIPVHFCRQPPSPLGIEAVPGRIPGGQPCPGSSAGAGFLEGGGAGFPPAPPALSREHLPGRFSRKSRLSGSFTRRMCPIPLQSPPGPGARRTPDLLLRCPSPLKPLDFVIFLILLDENKNP
jgi:hypothetical protein